MENVGDCWHEETWCLVLRISLPTWLLACETFGLPDEVPLSLAFLFRRVRVHSCRWNFSYVYDCSSIWVLAQCYDHRGFWRRDICLMYCYTSSARHLDYLSSILLFNIQHPVSITHKPRLLLQKPRTWFLLVGLRERSLVEGRVAWKPHDFGTALPISSLHRVSSPVSASSSV